MGRLVYLGRACLGCGELKLVAGAPGMAVRHGKSVNAERQPWQGTRRRLEALVVVLLGICVPATRQRRARAQLTARPWQQHERPRRLAVSRRPGPRRRLLRHEGPGKR